MKYLNKNSHEVSKEEFENLQKIDLSLYGNAYVEKNKKSYRLLDPEKITIIKKNE